MWHYHPRIELCADTLMRGGVVAYPTEAVWGLGCDPFNPGAVQQVLDLKHRHWRKGLILVADSIESLDFILDGLTDVQRQQLDASWPGHSTWLVPHHHRVPMFISGGHDTVAVRVSAHPVVKSLCRAFGGPIVSTSANPQGLRPARSSVHARKYFGKKGIAFCPGVVGAQDKPSEIRDIRSGAVIR